MIEAKEGLFVMCYLIYKAVFNVGCLSAYIWAKDKTCRVPTTTDMLALVSINFSLVQWERCCCRTGIPRVWNPQSQASLKDGLHELFED